ncbi:MAG: hypothetical protein U0414_09405 [Polyangiaceae bacterium]
MRAWWVAVFAFLSAVPAEVSAQPAEGDAHARARALLADGRRALDAGQSAEALRDFEEAHALLGSPFTAIWVARARESAGQLVEAREAALEVLRLPPEDDPKAIEAYPVVSEQAQEFVRQLDVRIPSAEIDAVGPPPGRASITLDGRAITAGTTVRLNPGKHEAHAEAEGFRPSAEAFEVKEGEARQLRLVLDPVPIVDPPRPPSPAVVNDPGPRADVLLGVGFGLAGIAILEGTVTGVLSLNRASELGVTCGHTHCPESLGSAWTTANDLATASTAGFVVGAAGLVVGAIGIAFKVSDTRARAEDAPKPLAEAWIGAGVGGARFAW